MLTPCQRGAIDSLNLGSSLLPKSPAIQTRMPNAEMRRKSEKCADLAIFVGFRTFFGIRISVLSTFEFVSFSYVYFVTAAGALEKQIQRYRQMSGEERLSLALELHELSCDIAREGIRRQHPRADAIEVERLLRHRLELARAG